MGLAASYGVKQLARAIVWRPVPEQVRDELDLLRFQRLRGQVPLLYVALMCLVTTAAFAVSAPVPQIIRLAIPLGILALCIFRLSIWMRRRHDVIAVDAARSMMRTMTVVSVLMCALCSLWGVMSWVLALPEDRS